MNYSTAFGMILCAVEAHITNPFYDFFSFPSRLEAIIVLESVFKTAPSNVILKAVQLLEGLVKNCKDSFHRAVASKGFQ